MPLGVTNCVVMKMKIKKHITLDDWIVKEIIRQHPRARHNFSQVASALLASCVNNPLAYWHAQAKLNLQRFELAKQHIETLEAVQAARKLKREELINYEQLENV